MVDEISRGWLYRETVKDEADNETVISDIARGQYERPVRIIALNTAEGWSRDVTEDVAREILGRAHARLSR